MMTQRPDLDTHQKALSLNLDTSKYGTIAELGAGQETARWFFRVGGAAGSIATARPRRFCDTVPNSPIFTSAAYCCGVSPSVMVS